MKLFINTGGKGVRLRPLTYELPKPMIMLNDKPVLHHIIDWGKKHGFTEFIFLNGYLHELIEGYFRNGEKFGVKIYHSNEPEPLGSAGPMKFAEKFIDSTFALVQGDVYCDIDIKKMIEFHKKNNGIMTILLHTSDHPEDSDVIQIDENNVVKNVIHKPGNRNFGNLTNAGLFIVEPKVLEYIRDGEKLDIEKDLYPRLIKAAERIIAYIDNEGYIKDMGTIERFKKIEAYLNG